MMSDESPIKKPPENVHPVQSELVLVTGANSGIGLKVSLALAREGYRLILLARNEERLLDVQKICEKVHPGAVVMVVSYDLTDVEGIRDLIGGIAASCCASPGVLVHCAGTAPRGYVCDLPASSVQNVIVLNTSSFIMLCGALLPAMRKVGSGRIVAITSGHALLGLPGFSAYSAAKAGMERILQSLKAENSSLGIKVMQISPGLVATDQTKEPESYSVAMPQRQEPLKKRTPENVADAVVISLATGKDVTLGIKQKIACHLAYWSPWLVRWIFVRS